MAAGCKEEEEEGWRGAPGLQGKKEAGVSTDLLVRQVLGD